MDLNRHFAKEDIQLASTDMKHASNTTSCHFTPVGMAIIEQTKDHKSWLDG